MAAEPPRELAIGHGGAGGARVWVINMACVAHVFVQQWEYGTALLSGRGDVRIATFVRLVGTRLDHKTMVNNLSQCQQWHVGEKLIFYVLVEYCLAACA